jgi:alpha-galactosidase/6-phospho-beta-glucosidase family protein
MVETVKEVERLVLQASIQRSKSALRKALALHPLCGGVDAASQICQSHLDGL